MPESVRDSPVCRMGAAGASEVEIDETPLADCADAIEGSTRSAKLRRIADGLRMMMILPGDGWPVVRTVYLLSAGRRSSVHHRAQRLSR